MATYDGDQVVTNQSAPVALSFLTSVTKCSRCGDDHKFVVMRRLARPVVMRVEHTDATLGRLVITAAALTHWGMCPTSREPILALIKEQPNA